MKRLASMLLTLCLLLGMAPPRVFAADTPPELVEALAEAVPDDAALLSVYGVPASEPLQKDGVDGAITIDGEFRTGDANGQPADTTGNGDTPSGTCGDNLTWTLVNGVLTISGTGAMTNYQYDNNKQTYTMPWADSRESITTVIIENGVTSIGNYAFIYCYNLKSVTTPDSVTSIGKYAFYDCDGLTNEVINTTIFDNVTSIGEGAFFSCDSLTSVTIPSNVTSIGDGAFNGGSSLTGVNVESGNTQYSSENGILFNKDKTILYCYPAGKKDEVTYTIPDSVTSIKDKAFIHCRLTNVTIHKGVTSIESCAFLLCKGLTSIIIPDSLTSIRDGTFSGCNALKNVTIPNSVTSVGEIAFEGCTALTDVDYGGTKAQWSAIKFGGNNEALTNATIHCTDGDIVGTQSADTYTVTFNPNGGTVNPTTATVQANTTVSEPQPTRDGYKFKGWFTTSNASGTAFDFKTPITQSLTLYAGWEALSAVSDCTVTFISEGKTLKQYVVEMNTKFSESVQTPTRDGYEFMGWFTTEDASGKAFNFDTPITGNLTLYAGWKPVSQSSDILAQGYCGGEGDGTNLSYVLTKDGTLTISGSGKMSEYAATTPAPWYGNRQRVKALVVASGVGTIGAYAFNGCTALTKMSAADTLTSVAPYAFDGCTALETVSFGGTLTQWDNVICNTSDNDPLEFADVTCGDTGYNMFRALEALGKMDTFADREWKFPAPLARFRNLYIDVENVRDAENNDSSGALERKASAAALTREEGLKAYAAESGSTVLTIPKETFKTFEEGSHRITATFQTKANPRDKDDTGFRQTSEVYTVFPEGPIVIDAAEIVKDAVQDVSYTARLQTAPKLSDRFYRFEIVGAQLGDKPLTVTTVSDAKQTEDEEATQVQRLGEQDFFFHPNGRFTGVPSIPGDYKLTVKLQVRREASSNDWYDAVPDDSHTNPVTVDIHVEAKTAANIKTTSPGYTVIQEPPVTLEQGTRFHMKVEINDPADELVTVYLDSQVLVKNTDYLVTTSVWDGSHWVRLEDAGGVTQLSIQVTKTNVNIGLHSLNLELKHTDIRGNTQTKNVARAVNVTQKTTPVSGGGGGGGGGGSSAPATYSIKAAKTSNGKITLSAKKSAAGKTVTITVTPDNGYAVKSVSATDSKKKSVTLTRNGNKYTFTMPKLTVTVSATFAPSSHSISVSSVQHGKVTLDKSTAASGTAVNGTATPDNGYLLSAVTVRDASGKSVKVETFNNGKFTFLMPSGNVTVSATFTPSAYNISAASAQHGKVTLDKSTAASGAAVNGTTTPDKGYLLSAVTVRDASGNNVKSETFDNGKFTFLMPSGAVTVSATFTVKRLASFGDIQGPDWFFDDAEWAYQKGILRGVTEQYWEPQSRISAVTSVVTLERLDGVDLSEYDTGAEDGLDNHAWYVAAARWAKVKGILPDGLSVDRDALSRGDFALMLANYLRYRGISEAPGDATFTDADTMSPAELDAFRILQKAGVFQGYKDGTIKPRGYLSRAHLSALLHRLSNYIIKAEQERFTGA